MELKKEDRNYESISPSATALLLMKGYTSIPFARQAAEWITQPEAYVPDFNRKDFSFWARTAHFETRYWSIDQLLEGLSISNILELSSGFSLRGLDAVVHGKVNYIDTDLPEVMAQKVRLIASLLKQGLVEKGRLELMPLNALDERDFENTVNFFPAGEVAIVNEGLLMYLGMAEKEQLCSIIHKLLQKRGGYWITADIYVRNMRSMGKALKLDDRLQQFLDEHKVEENKFEDFESAEAFFRKQGFVIDKEAVRDHSRITALTHMLTNASAEQLEGLKNAGKHFATWRLRVAD